MSASGRPITGSADRFKAGPQQQHSVHPPSSTFTQARRREHLISGWYLVVSLDKITFRSAVNSLLALYAPVILRHLKKVRSP